MLRLALRLRSPRAIIKELLATVLIGVIAAVGIWGGLW